jgi:hypothetical protein
MIKSSVLLIGATGETGKRILEALVDDNSFVGIFLLRSSERILLTSNRTSPASSEHRLKATQKLPESKTAASRQQSETSTTQSLISSPYSKTSTSSSAAYHPQQ